MPDRQYGQKDRQGKHAGQGLQERLARQAGQTGRQAITSEIFRRDR